ncbi:MAG TPA: Fe-S cluster assembly ATPase SufC [Ignavibacteriales bacterium]|nr:Fe-S cluster assembly ATPase SufC [Ignavibacteriales bacterium]HOM64280.1 Fe-S cluster assembly ATPase SufC [Ignavibacteriales bacterium]HPD68449.1 Fe-S cluster assembly ATPase SufC [Ignavibacteriales bacterium]HPP33074.1 Fe-S cluster assembly ATPase SufC [Ignavibacteriales bacterium]HRT98960.1 Fe-S cluster assembly ATPase SufC [Ignavibacteriales bacterium]
MLSIKNLHAAIGDKQILKGINLEIKPGEIHAIMGPNGSGKSTMAAVLSGKEGYEVTHGEIKFMGKDLLEMPPEDRAREGLFLAFQYPIEIPGINNLTLLKTAINEIRKYRGLDELDAMDFSALIKEKMKYVNINENLLYRSVNHGFSGGEKKKNEIFQLLFLEPKLAILDETDSGLDIDALKEVANGVNIFKEKNPESSVLLITHYQRLLNYIQPDYVHVLVNGRIAKSGGKELALELEEKGYDWIKEELVKA